MAESTPNLNPLVELSGGERPKMEKEDSATHFGAKIEAHVEKHGDLVAEKMAGKGLGEVDAVNQGALTRLMSGAGAGGLLEMATIAINFFQNFGIVTEIPIPWPESFKLLFTWLEIFSMDFSVFGGAQLGVWTSIWTGLLVPIWLIWMFDATWRRKFAPFFNEDMEIKAFWKDKDGDPLLSRR